MCKPKNRIMCPDCGKQKMLFETEAKANSFIKWNKDTISNGDELRAYYCPACCGWHISHMKFHKNMEGRTDKLIEAYNKEKAKARQIDIDNIDVLYNDLKEHGFKTRKEVNQYLNSLEPFTYSKFTKVEAKIKYYTEFNILKD